MAAIVLTDCVFTLNAVNLTTYCTSVSLSVEADDQETTAFGGNGYKSLVGGLKEFTVKVEFFQDFGSGAVDQTIFPLLGTVVPFTLKATSSAISTTNPEYQGSVLISEYSPLDGDVGDVSTTSASWPGSGALVRDTTP